MQIAKSRVHNKIQFQILVVDHFAVVLISFAAVFVTCALATIRQIVADSHDFEFFRDVFQKFRVDVASAAALADNADS